MATHVTFTERGLDEESLAKIRAMKTSELIMLLDEDVLIATFADAVAAGAALDTSAVRHLVEVVAAEVDRRIPVPG